MPLCNRKGSLLNLIIKDIEKEETGNSGSRSASVLPPGSPLLARSRAVAPGSPMTRRKGNSLPTTASPSLHRKFPSLMLNHPSSPRLQKRLSFDSKDVESNENRRTSPVKIKHRRFSKPELYKSKFSFEEEDIVHALKVQFRLGDDSSDDQRTETDGEEDQTDTKEITASMGKEIEKVCNLAALETYISHNISK